MAYTVEGETEAESYMEPLQIANIARLKKRGEDLCVKYMDKMKPNGRIIRKLRGGGRVKYKKNIREGKIK